MNRNPLNCQHAWIRTEDDSTIQCRICGTRREVENIELDMLPYGFDETTASDEYMEAL